MSNQSRWNGQTRWANAALDLPNFTIAVVDTTGVETTSDVIRVLTLDRYGHVNKDIIVGSGRKQGANTLYTGIDQDVLDDAIPLVDMWPLVRDAFRGNYVVTYGRRFVQARLDENASYYHISPPVTLLGMDLLEQATAYFGQTRFLKLSDACHLIGHTLPSYPDALTRAKAALELVKRMAGGPYLPLAAPPAPDQADEFERPF
jgi:hypothetical protein